MRQQMTSTADEVRLYDDFASQVWFRCGSCAKT
jgi:hypothetical protein